jgi:signal peptidase I
MASLTSKIIIGSIAVVLLALLPALVLIKALFINHYRIPQNGMYPGLPSGSLFFAAKRPYAAPSEVKRGDIVVFTRGEGDRLYNYIWRVIGLPGDTIEAARASLIINGQPVAREPLREEPGMVIFRERAGEAAYEVAIDQSPRAPPPDASVTVPADHFFVMGDNRLNAHDSRSFGPIPFGTIIGRKL